MTRRAVTVRVPATSANLGPGFDALGLALAIQSTLVVAVDANLADESADRPAVRIEVEGEGAASVSRGPDNLAYRAIRAVFEKVGRPVPPLHLRAENAIPLARGLGSSAAVVVAGLLAGNALCGDPLSLDDLLALGLTFEGHPDNIAPALLGGCIAATVHEGGVVWARVPLPGGLKAVLFVPDFEMPTKEARALLPNPVPRPDAVFNIGRVALLVASLATGRLDLLRVATEDRLHQIPRQAVFPAMPALFAAALEAGAYCAFLSGAGSAVIALCREGETAIAGAMAAAARAASLSGKTLLTSPSLEGAKISL